MDINLFIYLFFFLFFQWVIHESINQKMNDVFLLLIFFFRNELGKLKNFFQYCMRLNWVSCYANRTHVCMYFHLSRYKDVFNVFMYLPGSEFTCSKRFRWIPWGQVTPFLLTYLLAELLINFHQRRANGNSHHHHIYVYIIYIFPAAFTDTAEKRSFQSPLRTFRCCWNSYPSTLFTSYSTPRYTHMDNLTFTNRGGCLQRGRRVRR